MQDAGEAVLRMSKDMDNGTGRWGPWPQKTCRVHGDGAVARAFSRRSRVSMSASRSGALGQDAAYRDKSSNGLWDRHRGRYRRLRSKVW